MNNYALKKLYEVHLIFTTMLKDEHAELIINHLSQFITDHKKSFIENVLGQRTRHVTLVLEDIYQSQNASAVFRTAECFGIQDVRLIESLTTYSLNKRVLRGANKWLNLIEHKKAGGNNTAMCFETLKMEGYKIMATTPTATMTIEEVDISNKVAIVMGNELHGLSAYAQAHADFNVKIPMSGFTESLNLSVSAAICIYELMTRIRDSAVDWHLTTTEQQMLKLDWYRKSIKGAELIERKFLQSIK